MTEYYTAGFDGSAVPNPGEMKIGWWLKNPNGKVLHSSSISLGYETNNEAEYKALISLLTVVKSLNIKNIKIQGDSALVVNQVNGKWKTKEPRMKVLCNECKKLLDGIDWNLTHVVRKYNSDADSLTR